MQENPEDAETQEIDVGSGAPSSVELGAQQKKLALEKALPLFSPHVKRYRARQLLFDRLVEMRVLPDDADEETRKLFVLELEDLLNLDHPSLLWVMDHGVTRGRPYYLVPLRDYLPLARSIKRGDLSLEERCAVVRDLASIYAAAFRRKIHLGALSPIALAWDQEAAELHVIHHRFTPEVRTLPLPEPAPPDLTPGTAPSTTGDVFLWARLSYWVLAGKVNPFQGRGAATPIRSHVPTLARDLAHLIDACLVRNPDLRPTHMGEIAAVLEQSAEDVTEEIDLEKSGTIAHVRVKDSISDLRLKGLIQEVEAGVERRKAVLEEKPSLEFSLPESQTARWILGLCAFLLVGLVWTLLSPRRPEPSTTKGGSVTYVARPEPDPALAGSDLKPLAPSEQQRFLDDKGVALLLATGKPREEEFMSVWKQARDLAFQKRLPAQLAGYDRIGKIRKAFKKKPQEGLEQLEGFLADLHKVLGTGPGSPGSGDPGPGDGEAATPDL